MLTPRASDFWTVKVVEVEVSVKVEAVMVEVEVEVVEASDVLGDTIAHGTNPRLYFFCCLYGGVYSEVSQPKKIKKT